MRSVILFLAAFLLITSCDGWPFLGAGNGSNEAMSLKMTTEKIEVMQHIKADFIVTNLTNHNKEYNFPSSCQYGFKVIHDEEILFNSQYVFGCFLSTTSFELDPGESKTFKIDLRNGGDFEYLDSGKYVLEAFLLTDDSDTVSTTFTVK